VELAVKSQDAASMAKLIAKKSPFTESCKWGFLHEIHPNGAS
jgi:hypothetical protein